MKTYLKSCPQKYIIHIHAQTYISHHQKDKRQSHCICHDMSFHNIYTKILNTNDKVWHNVNIIEILSNTIF